MNINFEILSVTWRSKSTQGESISFYIIPIKKHEYFTSKPEDLKSSLEATEIYSVAKSEYINNKSFHDQKITISSDNISSRFTDNTLPQKKSKRVRQKNTPTNKTNLSLPSFSPIQRSMSGSLRPSDTPLRPIKRSSSDVSPVKRPKLGFSG